MDQLPVLHVLFSAASAETVKRACAQEDRPELVAELHDNFSFGPLNGDGEARIRWVDEKLGITNWHELDAGTAPFLAISCTPYLMPVAWFSRRDTQSYTGFLWWLSRLGDTPCQVMDVTDLLVSYRDQKPYLAVNPSELNQAQTVDLLGSQAPLAADQRAEYLARWRQLVAENADLRVIDGQGSLVSAPLTHFDALLLSLVTPFWRKMSLLVSQARIRSWEGEVRQTSDFLLYSRLCELAETGVLEWRGDLNNMQRCEVRLPA